MKNWSMPSVDRKIFFLFIGRAVQAIIAVLNIRLMTEFLSQTEVGSQYLISSIIMWFSLVLINPLGMYVNRHVHEWNQNRQLYFFIKELNKYFAGIALISIPIVYVVKTQFGVGDLIPEVALIAFIMCSVFFATWFNTLVSFFNLFDFQKILVLLNIFALGIGLIFAILLSKLVAPTALSWMSGILLGQIFILVVTLALFYRMFPRDRVQDGVQQEKLFSKSTLNFCYPVAITTLFMWFMNQGYRLIVERYWGVDVLAAIGVGLGLAASVAGVVEAITTQYFYPQYYAALANSDLSQRRRAWQILRTNTIIVYVPFFFLLF
jgi:O-antigen/teichoic acid export membrane protein